MVEIRNTLVNLLNHSEYKVSIRKAGKYTFNANYKFETHKHPEFEINYINKGTCVMVVENQYVPLKEGDYIVINPHVFHSFMVDISKKCSITQLEYSVKVPLELKEKVPALNIQSQYIKINSYNSINKSLENVCRCFREYKADNEYLRCQLDFALAQVYAILSEQILQSEETELTNLHGVIGEVVNYINDNIGTILNLEEIAKKYNVSDRYLRKSFNKNLGMNFTKYVTMLRIAKSKELLWNSSMNITEIALLCGFNSSQYFSRVFKKYTKMTPGEYRKMWKEKV